MSNICLKVRSLNPQQSLEAKNPEPMEVSQDQEEMEMDGSEEIGDGGGGNDGDVDVPRFQDQDMSMHGDDSSDTDDNTTLVSFICLPFFNIISIYQRYSAGSESRRSHGI